MDNSYLKQLGNKIAEALGKKRYSSAYVVQQSDTVLRVYVFDEKHEVDHIAEVECCDYLSDDEAFEKMVKSVKSQVRASAAALEAAF